jgi:hypothetical protein
MVAVGCLQLRPSESGEKFNGPELFEGDVKRLRQLFPDFSLWKTIGQDDLCLTVTLDQGRELLELLNFRLNTQEWNTTPYFRSAMGSNKISEPAMLLSLKTFIESELAVLDPDGSKTKTLLPPLNERYPEDSNAPACNVCGSITVRSGTAFRCLNCGNHMGNNEPQSLPPEASPDITFADVKPGQNFLEEGVRYMKLPPDLYHLDEGTIYWPVNALLKDEATGACKVKLVREDSKVQLVR